MTTIRVLCPSCQGSIDVTACISGDVVWHSCGATVLIRHRAGGTDAILQRGPLGQQPPKQRKPRRKRDQ